MAGGIPGVSGFDLGVIVGSICGGSVISETAIHLGCSPIAWSVVYRGWCHGQKRHPISGSSAGENA